MKSFTKYFKFTEVLFVTFLVMVLSALGGGLAQMAAAGDPYVLAGMIVGYILAAFILGVLVEGVTAMGRFVLFKLNKQ